MQSLIGTFKQISRAMPAVFVALAICLPSAPAIAGVKIEHWQSPSGARVFFVETHALPMLDVNVDFHAGSALDPKGKEGLAALASGLIKLGAGSLDENQISEQLADLGARISASSDSDRFSVSLRTLSAADKQEAATALFTQIIEKPTFPATVFTRERESTIVALKDSLTRPDTLASRAFWSSIYPDHPYGRLTTPESLARLTRDDIAAFHHTYFASGNAVISIVGDLTRKEAETLAERLVKGLPKTAAASTAIADVNEPKAQTVRIDHHAAQAHIFLGLPALKRGDPDFFPLTVGNYTLGGGGFVSRLMQEVREKRGFAYSVYSYFSPMQAAGPFQIGLQTKREQADEALKVVNTTFDRFLAEGPSNEELTAAKQNLVGSFPLRLDSNGKILGNLAVIGFYGLPLDYLDRYAENVERVTAAEIRAAFTRHVKKENLVTVILGGAEKATAD